MKKILTGMCAVALILFAACNNSSNKAKEEQGMSKMNNDSPVHAAKEEIKDVAEKTALYTNVDTKAAASVKEIVAGYLGIKNSLTNDNDGEAASGGKAMAETMGKIDKSFFNSVQKRVYDNIEDDLKEHAEHIGKNAGNIKHQREHFAMMSEDVYDLVKAFGGGQPIYHDHCPMYNDGKGAIWLSEMKEVKNPYYGKEMPRCGTVEEVIK